mgnify:CR=1 FL=1
MTSYRDETIAGVQRLEMHDFGQNPTVAVESALFDVARFGVSQLCNIGPVLSERDNEKMFRWAKSNPDIYGNIESQAEMMASKAYLLDGTLSDLQANLAHCTVAGVERNATFIRYREPAFEIKWHTDISFPAGKSGVRALFPMGQSDGSSLVVSRLQFDGDHKRLQKDLSQVPLSAHLRIMYKNRTAILMAEGIGGMKVMADDGKLYGVESPPHSGLHDLANPCSRVVSIADFVLRITKANNNAFVVPISPEDLRLAS